MLFRSTDLLHDFERLTKGLNFGPGFDQAVDDLSTAVNGAFAGDSNLDVLRSEDHFEIFLDLPGVDPAAVELTVDGRTLTVTADRHFAAPEGSDLVHAGRRHGSFSRSFKLADDLDVDALSARSDNGVLIVTVPVIAAPAPRKISISTEG